MNLEVFDVNASVQHTLNHVGNQHFIATIVEDFFFIFRLLDMVLAFLFQLFKK